MRSAKAFSCFLLLMIVLIGCTDALVDPYTNYTEMLNIINFTDLDASLYLQDINSSFSGYDDFAKGDYYLIQARLANQKEIACKAVAHYKAFVPANDEEKAIVYETIGSLGCGEDSRRYYKEAAKLWREMGNAFRAELDEKLAGSEEIVLTFSIPEIKQMQMPSFETGVVIGNSSLALGKNDIVLAEAERVSRDWLSGQIAHPYSEEILTVFSEKNALGAEELREDIGWHEGGRLKELQKGIGSYRIGTGTLAGQYNGRWYAPNEKGVFMFEIPYDKIAYPTTRFLRKNLALIIDVHGINMLVEQAMRSNSTAVMGCCDYPGKIAAAEYLANKGKKVLCFTDRFVPMLIGKNVSVIGSAPFEVTPAGVVIGNRPVLIAKDDIVVAQDVEDRSAAQQYYDTAARYFSYFPGLKVINYTMRSNNDTYAFVAFAKANSAGVIGGRVYSFDDYKAYQPWLQEDQNHRLALFHSMAYPYGKLLFEEFPNQTTFGDINPDFVSS